MNYEVDVASHSANVPREKHQSGLAAKMEWGESKGVLVESPQGGRKKEGVVGTEALDARVNEGTWDDIGCLGADN